MIVKSMCFLFLISLLVESCKSTYVVENLVLLYLFTTAVF